MPMAIMEYANRYRFDYKIFRNALSKFRSKYLPIHHYTIVKNLNHFPSFTSSTSTIYVEHDQYDHIEYDISDVICFVNNKIMVLINIEPHRKETFEKYFLNEKKMKLSLKGKAVIDDDLKFCEYIEINDICNVFN